MLRKKEIMQHFFILGKVPFGFWKDLFGLRKVKHVDSFVRSIFEEKNPKETLYYNFTKKLSFVAKSF